MPHAFKIGQTVSLVQGLFTRFEVVQTFTIVRHLPEMGEAFQYRVRGDVDGRERVVKEHDIVQEG